jgi:hypothetical protein
LLGELDGVDELVGFIAVDSTSKHVLFKYVLQIQSTITANFGVVSGEPPKHPVFSKTTGINRNVFGLLISQEMFSKNIY